MTAIAEKYPQQMQGAMHARTYATNARRSNDARNV